MAQIVFTVEVDNLDVAQFVVHNLGWDAVEVRTNDNRVTVSAPIDTFVGDERPTVARAQAKFWENFANQLDWESHEF